MASEDSGMSDEMPADKGALKPIAETTRMERVAFLVALLAGASSVAAMVWERSIIVFLAGIVSIVLGSYSYVQQTRLTDIYALQETHEAVEHEVDRLQAENERLSQSINELAASVEKLEEIQKALDVVTKTQGSSIATLAEQVAMYRENLELAQSKLEGKVLNNMISIIMSSDKDSDNIIDADEVEEMIHRIQNISGVEVHDDRFRKAFTGSTFDSLANIAANLMNDHVPEDERIFDIRRT